MNELNNRVSFTAKLSTESLAKRTKKWDKVERIFESKTSKIDNYELILFNSKNDVVLSTYDGDLQRLNILSKEGFKKLDSLTVNGIATKLAKFLRSVVTCEKKANKIVDDTAKVINKNKLEEPTISIMYDKAINLADESYNTNLNKIIEEDNVFKNTLKTSISANDIED